jgi:hypothetical protein
MLRSCAFTQIAQRVSAALQGTSPTERTVKSAQQENIRTWVPLRVKIAQLIQRHQRGARRRRAVFATQVLLARQKVSSNPHGTRVLNAQLTLLH